MATGRLGGALAGWAALGLPYELAGRADLGAADGRQGARGGRRPRPQAARHLRPARRKRLAADRVAALLRSLGVAARTGAKGTGGLTEREQEVWTLLGGRGLTNPEIAARLHVSRKTAAHHVSSILTKLGLRNRAEVAVRSPLGPTRMRRSDRRRARRSTARCCRRAVRRTLRA